MKKYLFKLVCPGSPLRLETLTRDTYPSAGDTLTIFNFPIIERYVIERLERRPDWWEHDHCDQMALVVRFDTVLQTAASQDNVIAFNPDAQIDTRLMKIEKVARKTVDSQLDLEIARSDFEALCRLSGLAVAVEEVDAFAYNDIPMKVGEPGAWNAATAFGGYSDDRHVLYVTWPGGRPFVMSGEMLEIAKLFYELKLSVDQAIARAMSVAVECGVVETRGLQNAMREMFSLIADGLMPVYDGAQALTRMTLPSYAATLDTIWKNRDNRPAPQGTRYVDVSVADGVDVASLVDALTGLKPSRH